MYATTNAPATTQASSTTPYLRPRGATYHLGWALPCTALPTVQASAAATRMGGGGPAGARKRAATLVRMAQCTTTATYSAAPAPVAATTHVSVYAPRNAAFYALVNVPTTPLRRCHAGPRTGAHTYSMPQQGGRYLRQPWYSAPHTCTATPTTTPCPAAAAAAAGVQQVRNALASAHAAALAAAAAATTPAAAANWQAQAARIAAAAATMGNSLAMYAR